MKAVNDFIDLTQLAPRAPIAWCGRAAASYGVGDFASSLAAAKYARDLAPHDPRPYFVLAPPAYALADRTFISLCANFVGALDPQSGRNMASFWSQRLAEKNFFGEAADAFGLFALKHPNEIGIGFQYVDLLLNAFRLEEAEKILMRISALGATPAGVDALFARIHVARGDIKAASDSAARAITADPDCIVAYAVLADVEPGRVDGAGAARLERLISSDACPIDKRIVGGVALGRVFEKEGDIDSAFAAFTNANKLSAQSLAAAGMRYDRSAGEADVRREIARYPSPPDAAETEDASPRLLFIIGMPRSGSTLVDQILSRHSAVASVGESMIVPQFVDRISHRAKASGGSSRDFPIGLREEFMSAYAKAGAAGLVVDKNLFNFQHCGLIADLDPGARFILVLRDPGDVALSIFRMKFLATHPWSNDLDDIAHTIACFELLTDHWRRLFADRMRVLQYETLVKDFEGNVRALLDFCGLGFEPECLEFHEGERAVFTQSATQVRRPLSAEGIGRWRRYERHLEGFWRSLDDFRRRLRVDA
ncbi:MAG: tetratricopeptide repeat-containing sulfotransferase family protein [Pseudomonadota bacterium]